MFSVVCRAGLQYMAEKMLTDTVHRKLWAVELTKHGNQDPQRPAKSIKICQPCSPACEGESPDLAGCAQNGHRDDCPAKYQRRSWAEMTLFTSPLIL